MSLEGYHELQKIGGGWSGHIGIWQVAQASIILQAAWLEAEANAFATDLSTVQQYTADRKLIRGGINQQLALSASAQLGRASAFTSTEAITTFDAGSSTFSVLPNGGVGTVGSGGRVAVGPRFVFPEARTGAWFDPVMADAYMFETGAGSLFTAILSLPTGFSDAFTVIAEGANLLRLT